jgi:zinc transport system substrate-binding protein
MKKILFIIVTILIIGLGVLVILNIIQKPKNSSQKITIVTTLFPLYDFAKNIGQDKVEVSLLLPPGIEAHSFEPKPSDIIKINNANIFVYTGEFMEPWAHDIIKSASKNVKIVDASKGIKFIKEEQEQEHNHNGVDPHIWLDFDNAKIMIKNITDALIEIDPQNSDYYQNNLKVYQDALSNLDYEYKNTLSVCKSKTIIYGGHYVFGYMAKRYGLEYLSAYQGFSPDSEPTAKDIIFLLEKIKKDNIKYIFYEEITNPKIAQILAKEANVKMIFLNGAHNLTKKDYESGASFISIMEENLKNLSRGLDCQK